MCLLAGSPAHADLPTRTILSPPGLVPSSQFGNSAAGVGDFNADGYPDFAVGAPGVSAVYVYWGGPGADNVWDLETVPTGGSDGLGWSVAGAGDVNGDGYPDLIVGAPGDQTGGTQAGRAYLFFGGPGADLIADRTFTGVAGDFLGYSVGGGTDINGDSYDDLIIGACGNPIPGFLSAGRVYIYLGGPNPDTVADYILTGETSTSAFGFSVAAVGNVNGDGYEDFAVGSITWDDGFGGYNGRAYVFFGGPGSPAGADMVLTGGDGDLVGAAVAGAGDVNSDGFPDVIVGAPTDTPSYSKAFVLFGGAAPDGGADLVLTDGSSTNGFGNSVGAAGDVNGDGHADMIVGARSYGLVGQVSPQGRVYVYFGGAALDENADLAIDGPSDPNAQFGYSVSALGDLDSDGFDDILVGAPYALGGATVKGRAYVFGVSAPVVLLPNGGEQWVAGESEIVQWAGSGLATVSFSADGGITWETLASDLGGRPVNETRVVAPAISTDHALIRVDYQGVIPSRASRDLSDAEFRVRIPSRAPASAYRIRWIATGAAGGDQAGASVAPAGDFNGDGYPDVIVGAPYRDAAGLDAGQAYLFYGGPVSDGVADLILSGAAAGDNFGWSVAAAGDMNGDGYGDVIVGAPGSDAAGSNAGRAYVFFGGAMPDATSDLILTGAAAGDQFGSAVSTAGDFNGDGYADVIAGSPTADAPLTDAGRAYVYYGGAVPDNSADLLVSGSGVFDQLGTALASGDINGDGISDLVIGIPFKDHEPGLDAGTVRILYGSTAPDDVSDLILFGDTAGAAFGYAVSVGDADGDGRMNVLVGAPLLNTATGAAYLFTRAGESSASGARRYDGEATGDFFGLSVSLSGDLNGDGFADPLVGAPYNDAAGNASGKAYVFYGGPGADRQADLVVRGSSGDQLGYAVAGVGDLFGDGIGGDALMGASQAAGVGTAYLYDFSRYRVVAPNGGETWQVGALKEVRWSGAEPANVWLSVDGGQSYELLRDRVGGLTENTLSFRVPHKPTKFARMRITPWDGIVGGQDETDSLFTIQTSVSLLALLAAPAPEGARGAVVSWSTDPGPEDLAGYRLERGNATIVALTRETSFVDPDAGPGSVYRLYAVNGLGEEVLVGETSFAPRVPLAAWPLPYRGGALSIAYASGAGFAGSAAPTEVALFDVHGRLVRTIASGPRAAGFHAAVWDGRDERGAKVAAGVYLLRVRSAGQERSVKVAVLR